MCDQAMKHSANQVWVNSLVWYLINRPELPGLTLTTDSESTESLGGAEPGKEDSSHHVGKAEGVGDSAKPPKLYAPPYEWNGWWTAEWVVWSSSYAKQWEEQPLNVLLVWATDLHHEAHIPTKGKIWRVQVLQTWMVEPSICEHGSNKGTWRKEAKSKTPEQTPTHDIRNH